MHVTNTGWTPVSGRYCRLPSSEHALGIWESLGTLFFGWAQAEPADDLLAAMRKVIASFRADGCFLYLTFFPMLLADVEIRAGEFDRAYDLLTQAIEDSDRSGQCWFLPELLRRRAALAQRRYPAWPAQGEKILVAPCSPPASSGRPVQSATPLRA